MMMRENAVLIRACLCHSDMASNHRQAEKQPVVLRRYTIAELNADQSQRLGKEIK